MMQSRADAQESEVRTFMKEIRRYSAIEELDEAVLNRLISKILVGEVSKVDDPADIKWTNCPLDSAKSFADDPAEKLKGTLRTARRQIKVQEVRIIYNFVGEIPEMEVQE